VTSVMWFRRDLRLRDYPALLVACLNGEVLALFVLDPALWDRAGPSRRSYLSASLRSLDSSLRAQGGRLSVVRGDPVSEVRRAAEAVGARHVHVAADFMPYGRRRDELVAESLEEAGAELVRTGSPYAVAPGRLTTGGGTAYQVFTPFHRAWLEHGWRPPAGPATHCHWVSLDRGTTEVPDPPLPAGLGLPGAGEEAARRRWSEFLDSVAQYDQERDKPGTDGTSRMSVHLKYGEVHPRSLLADLGAHESRGAATFRKELAWRDFYADVTFHQPRSAREYLRTGLAAMAYDEPGARLEAWKEGRTGFPIVDAGMRQLRAAGWVHNRVRMIVASFLVKDLHVEWQHGARHFMHWLVDGDLPSNQHGWQWVAGSGTDPAPYFRVFNPTSQGRKFDPEGAYIRRWVHELRDDDVDPHEPDSASRQRLDYPEPIVDHAEERREAIARWERIRE
jgi:deoxyribodipyrimidine photo-lyase